MILINLKLNLYSQITFSLVILLFSLIFILINHGSLTKSKSTQSVEIVRQKPTFFEGANYSYFIENHCGIEFYPCSPFLHQDIEINKRGLWTLFKIK